MVFTIADFVFDEILLFWIVCFFSNGFALGGEDGDSLGQPSLVIVLEMGLLLMSLLGFRLPSLITILA